MKPSSLSWLLSVNSTANQMKVASTSPSLAMSPSVSTPRREQHAEAEERDRRRVEPERRGRRPQRRPCRRRSRRRSSRRGGAARARGSASRAAAGASGVAVTSGADELVEQERQQRHRGERRHGRRRASHEPKPISTPTPRAISAPSGFAAIAVNHSAEDSAQARHAGEHQEAPEPSRPAVARLRARGLGERQRERIEHARARGVAGKRGRDQAVDQEDAVAEARASSGRTG